MKALVTTPGYHIKPKYDLKQLRKLREGHGRAEVMAELNLTSMIDMFTVVVIFLLMNFSATGEIFYVQKNLKLPAASNSKPIETAPLISVTADSVTLEAEKVGDNPLVITESDVNLPRLSDGLKKIRIFDETLHPDVPFSGRVNIQADEKTPLVYIKRVMQACITEGYPNINFVTRATDEKGSKRPSAEGAPPTE